MKWKIKLVTALFGLALAGPVLSHHAAEGIVSDDIWQMIDSNLTLVDSPHLTIDFDDVMGSMRVGESQGDGSLFLISSITVRVEDVEDYMAVVEDVMNQILENPADESRIPAGILESGKSHTLDWLLVDLGDGLVEIVLREPIGGFSSQPDYEPATPAEPRTQPRTDQGG
jgi:hypothetical protein